ncbi:MAG: phosphoethanolamine--lipid A transferase [Candidatus Electrothrix sp. AX5]|nr:phosphoethanolamine--lipid A transferase [Candidatus Electrothrix sp. AX5]
MISNYLSAVLSKKKEITATQLVIFSSFFFIIFGNVTFFRHILEVYPFSFKNFFFLVSLAAGGTLAITLFLTLVASICPAKPLLILFLVISSVAAYVMDTYDTVIDHIMIQNIVETNWDETSDLLNLRMVGYVFVLGLLPSYAVYRVAVQKESLKRAIFRKIRDIFIVLIAIFAIVLTFSKFYTSFFREHEPLRWYSNPIYYVYSLSKYIDRNFSLHDVKIAPLGLDATVEENIKEDKEPAAKKLIILVVGEAARADHFSLDGYPRETNPLLKKEDIVNFSKVFSCGTSTAYSVPCMFSVFPRSEFNSRKGKETENVLDVLQHTGLIDILWRDNNSDSKGVALRVPYEDYRSPENNTICEDGECRDEGMLVGLNQYIEQHEGKDILIVLHQMGNHGPAYYKRYPKQFEQFTPTCQTNQLEDCKQEEIINAYDNALLYTDYFLAQIIGFLKQYDNNHKTAMIYLSDHGESLGESGVYLHGLPYMIAPDAQKHVGAVMWFGKGTKQDINLDLLGQKKDKELSHDNLFHTLLGLLAVKTAVYEKELDILNDELIGNEVMR